MTEISQIWKKARSYRTGSQSNSTYEPSITNILCFEVPVICFNTCCPGFRWSFYVAVSKMRTFVALVLYLTLLFAADGDIDDEEEKLPTKCHGM